MSQAGLCFRSLDKGHIAKGCASKCSKCNARHHDVCCYQMSKGDNYTGDNNANSMNTTPKQLDLSRVGIACSDKISSKCSILQTASVYVCLQGRETRATLLFDSEADRSYVSSALIKRADPEGTSAHTCNITFAAFGGGKSDNQRCNVFNLHIKGACGGIQSREPFSQVEVPVICTPLPKYNVPISLLQSLGKVEWAVSIDILIGLDNYWRFIKSGIVHIADGLVAQESVFGWVLSRSCQASSCSPLSHQLLCMCDTPDSTLRSFWELESIGITCEDGSSGTSDILAIFNESVRFKDGRYEISLPWKENAAKLVSNEAAARARLFRLQRTCRLDKSPSLKDRYNQVFIDMENSGIIEEVTETQVSYPTFNLPHHPVIQFNSIQFNSVTSIAPKSSEMRTQRRRIQIETSSMSRVKA